MQVVRHFGCILMLGKKTKYECFLGGWGWMFQSWVNYLLDCFSNVWGVHTSMMHGQDLHHWSFIPPKSFISLSFKTCGLKNLDCMDNGHWDFRYAFNYLCLTKKKTFQNGDHQNTCIHNIEINKMHMFKNVMIAKRHMLNYS